MREVVTTITVYEFYELSTAAQNTARTALLATRNEAGLAAVSGTTVVNDFELKWRVGPQKIMMMLRGAVDFTDHSVPRMTKADYDAKVATLRQLLTDCGYAGATIEFLANGQTYTP